MTLSTPPRHSPFKNLIFIGSILLSFFNIQSSHSSEYFTGTIIQTKTWDHSRLNHHITLYITQNKIRREIEESYSDLVQGIIIDLEEKRVRSYWQTPQKKLYHEMSLQQYDKWLAQVRSRYYKSIDLPIDSDYINIKTPLKSITEIQLKNSKNQCRQKSLDDGYVLFEIEECSSINMNPELLNRIGLYPEVINYFPITVARLSGKERQAKIKEPIKLDNHSPTSDQDSMMSKILSWTKLLFNTVNKLGSYQISTIQLKTGHADQKSFHLSKDFKKASEGEVWEKLFQRNTSAQP